MAQALLLGLLHKALQIAIVAGNHHITAQQLACIALQPGFQAVGKKCHRRQRRHGQRDGQPQQAQLTRTRIAPQCAPP